jgi:hypothetical protein
MAGRTDVTNRSADEVLAASNRIQAQAGRLTEEFERFFRELRDGPGERRATDNPDCAGPRRRKSERSAAA